MDVTEFRKDLFEEVKATTVVQGSGSSAAFVEIASEYLISAEVLADFTSAFYVGTGKNNRKLRVDGYSFDEFDLSFSLVIADYTGEETPEKITRTAASAFFDRLFYFVEEAFDNRFYKTIEPSTSASDLVDLLRENKDRIRKFRLMLLTDGSMSERITEIPSSNLSNIPVECQIWDIERIFRVCISDLGRQDIQIDFKAYTEGNNGIPCIEASSANSNDYRSYLCIIPGATLADIYDHYGSQLLEGNVRSFLSTKVAVNKNIRETILRNPQHFFAYNNGISATAMELKFESTETGKYITYAKDFQVINGGQTTASLSNSRYKDKADLSRIYVQMKLTEVDNDTEKAVELIRNISRSSNSQNKVSDADFFATHPFHIRIEQISRKLFASAKGGVQYETKWLYERARGQYLQAQMRMSKSEKAKFTAQHPKNQVITKTDLAKVQNTWMELPHVVSKGAQTNFMQFAAYIDECWNKSDASFNDKYYKDAVALSILFKYTEALVSKQSWYEQGYRANIVTYSLSLLHHLIANQFPGMELDLQQIWNRQTVPDLVSNELAVITKHVFDRITDPKRGTINVTQWCKQKSCWERVKSCDLILSRDLEACLLSKEEVNSEVKEAKANQEIISDIQAQEKVLELGPDIWKSLAQFIQNKKIKATQDQIDALKYAMRIPDRFPSSYQSVRLLSLLAEAESNGFVA